MDQLLAFIIKEFKHLMRDIRTITVVIGIPIIQLLLFGHVISTEIKDATIGIIDLSRDEVSVELTNKLLASGYFRLEEQVASTDAVEELFKKGKVKEVVVFEEDFGKHFVEQQSANLLIITDASDPNSAGLVAGYTQSIIRDFIREKNVGMGKDLISIESRMLYNEELRSANLFVPGTIALILMLISALMTSLSITREKELGTMEILLVSPLRPIQIILGKVIPYLSLSFLNSILIIGVGYFVFHVPVQGSVILLFSLCLLFILLALSLGIFISTVAKTQQVAMLISLIGLMLPTVLLSGFIFPVKNMPVALQLLSLIMPPRWFLDALKDVMLKGSGIKDIWQDVLIMLAMMVGLIALSIKKFNIRLEEK